MTGGLIHLVYIGNQDKVLTELPEITFFKTVYSRHSTFAIQDHYLQSETDIDFGDRTYFILRAFGDLLFRPYLKITLPNIVASYKTDIIQNINLFWNTVQVKNTNTNIILSKHNALLHNYKTESYHIYINDSLSLKYNYEDCTYGNRTNDIIPDSDIYTLLPFTPLTSYELAVTANNITIPSKIVNRNIYYSPYNISYLTTELTKLSFDDNTIYSADDYFEIFRDTIFNNITVNDENKFIYTLLNNKQLYTYNLTQQNIEKTITNEITYTLDYIYSNIKFLYIYKTSNTGKSLKSIFLVEDYSYSNFSYTNKLRPVTNLYTYIDNYTPTTNITLYIADGYNTNKSFNIHLIKESIILNNGSYDISSNIVKDPNKLYMIYPDQLPRDQGLLNGSGNEDYLDLFFNKHSKDNKYIIYIILMNYYYLFVI